MKGGVTEDVSDGDELSIGSMSTVCKDEDGEYTNFNDKSYIYKDEDHDDDNFKLHIKGTTGRKKWIAALLFVLSLVGIIVMTCLYLQTKDDIDHCLESKKYCDTNAECLGRNGTFECSCKQSFEGDGFNCTVIGSWSSWSNYTSCTKSCSVGRQERQRTCNNPSPDKFPGNAVCHGPSTETRTCNHQCCPVNGGWSEWRSVAPCSRSCGANGFMKRTRYCNNPHPSCGGKSCGGLSVEYKPCNRHCCPGDGGWSVWSNWLRGETRWGRQDGPWIRHRKCNKPAPTCGGTCKGKDIDQCWRNCITYKDSSAAMSWNDAKLECRTWGGFVAVPTNEGENTELHDMVRRKGLGNIWLGISDAASEGQWISPFTDGRISYHHWRFHEPNGKSWENCAEMYADDGTWNDISCSQDWRRFICMKDLAHPRVLSEYVLESGIGSKVWNTQWSGYFSECPKGSFVDQFRVRIDYKGWGDKTGLTNVLMKCKGYWGELKNHAFDWGEWGRWRRCSGYMVGYQLQMCNRHVGAVNLGIYCSEDPNKWVSSNSWKGWGHGGNEGPCRWGPKEFCQAGYFVCGIQVQYEKKQGLYDDSAITNVKMKCCSSKM